MLRIKTHMKTIEQKVAFHRKGFTFQLHKCLEGSYHAIHRHKVMPHNNRPTGNRQKTFHSRF